MIQMPIAGEFKPSQAAACVAAKAVQLAVLCLLSACAAGPDFKPPAAPAVTGYLPQPLLPQTAAAPVDAGEAQQFHQVGSLPKDWWKVFQSPKLNQLIERAFAANPNISAAQAALQQAKDLKRAQEGLFQPTVQASYSPSRQGVGNTLATPLSSGANVYNLHTTQLNVSYTPDVFGNNQRQVESLQAQAESLRFALQATYLTLASNLAVAAIQEASLRAQIAGQQTIIADNQHMMDLLREQFRLGYAMGLDVAAQETQLAQAEQALLPLQKQLDQQRDQIAVLGGKLPGDGVEQTFEFSDFTLPTELPLLLPSALVRQRPDVRAAEEQLHAATAQVGVALSNMMPQFSLNASAGGVATVFSQMFSAGNVFWSLVGGVGQSLFDGGTLTARKSAADAGVLQAEAQYRSTVVGAFQNVADTLYALQADSNALAASAKAEAAAHKTFDITRQQLAHGYVNGLALWNAEQAYQSALQNTVQARANRYSDTAALFQALGGGWWTSTETASGITETSGS